MAFTKTGTSDMNFFYLTTKAPCLAFGPGDAAFSYTSQEGTAESYCLGSIGVCSSLIRKVLKS